MKAADPLVEVQHLKKYFPVTQGMILQRKVADVRAVDGVSFAIKRGETLGLVGESGSGKTTIGRLLLRLHEPTSGSIYFDGHDLLSRSDREMRGLRRRMQMIFQDPYASLNPRMTIGTIVAEPLDVHERLSRVEKREGAERLLDMVGIQPGMVNRYPHEFSGGQRQRIGIARALALNPDLIVCDEPIASLDVSIQAQVVNLLKDLQTQLNLTFLFIAHDLSMVRHVSDRMAVMYLGKLMELTSTRELTTRPRHPYTRALLSAIPSPNPDENARRAKVILKGDIPSPVNPPQGCNFNTRCPEAEAVCFKDDPDYREIVPGHFVSCHLA